ncbi:rhomboid family [Fusarium mundagurra]|uniref:Rhomboid family n=1 Tax=Fusarium mundagurra TaxID=1567541 RepID=A0A8H5Y3D6_9HYPO|nr:rhomboid family [Fusarium mundagurra]
MDMRGYIPGRDDPWAVAMQIINPDTAANAEDQPYFPPHPAVADAGQPPTRVAEDPTVPGEYVNELPNTAASIPANRPGRRRKYDNLDWESHRAVLKQLYLDENKTLAETMAKMKERYSFVASEKLYKLQFKKWAWQKNLPATHSQFMVDKINKRRREERKETVFTFGGQKWDYERVQSLPRKKAQRHDDAQGKDTYIMRYIEYPTPAGMNYETPTNHAIAPAEDSSQSGPSGGDSDVDMTRDEDNLPEYVQVLSGESSDTDDVDVIGDTHAGYAQQLRLTSNGWTRDQLLRTQELARTYKIEGNMAKAEDLFLQTIEGLSEIMGSTHSETTKIKYECVSLYAEKGQMEEAYAMLDDMTQDHIKTWGHSHKRTQQHVLFTVELLETWSKSTDAIGLLSRSKEILDSLPYRNSSARRSRRRSRTARGPNIDALAEEITREGSLTKIDYGIGVARSHVTARNKASEMLLKAIIQHCSNHPEGLALQHLQALSELSSLYEKLGQGDVHEPQFIASEQTVKAVFQNYDWKAEKFQCIEVLEAAMQLAANILKAGYKRISTRLFRLAQDKAENLFGSDDERTVWILITIGLAYQNITTWDDAAEWFEAAFAASLANEKWSDQDGIVQALQNGLEKRHFTYLSDEGRPYKTVFGICGISIRPGRLHLE